MVERPQMVNPLADTVNAFGRSTPVCALRPPTRPPIIPTVNALQTTPDLPDALRKETDPTDDLVYPEDLIQLSGGAVVVLLSAVREGTFLYRLAHGDDELQPIPGFESVDGIWAASEAFLCRVDASVRLVEVDGTARDLVALPKNVTALAASWLADGPRLSALVDDGPEQDPDAPLLSPSPRPTVSLQTYKPTTGWREVTRVPAGCQSLSQSTDGHRIAWVEPTNVIPEEAQLGQFRGVDVDDGHVMELTTDAGQAHRVSVAPDGSGVVLDANFTTERPITTHLDLWWQPWDEATRINLTGGGKANHDWGWLDDGRLWVARVDGLHRHTDVLKIDGEQSAWDGSPAVLAAASDDPRAYVFADMAQFPTVVIGDQQASLPQSQSFDDLTIRTLSWQASDELNIEGVLYERIDTPDGAPVLVRAHGGPAGEVEAVRGEAVRHRHLLRAGYRVFEPAFRGSKGFGDDFLAANIGCQGDKDLDDILTGMDRLVQMGLTDTDRFGIFGGSYGGYMTLRGVAATDRFRAGVALYGFIENRRMTLETGDFTYEEEYIAPVTWPMGGDSVGSDVFSHLHAIDTPTLLLHGDRDPICTLSQSQIVYGALKHRGVATGLVVYPGEEHGFRKPVNRRDCAQRTLAWFLEYLPIEN